MESSAEIKVKAYTKGQLAAIYQVSRRTFMRWVKRNPRAKEIEPPDGYIYTPCQVAKIFEIFGLPPS
ncbi:MAG: hypothetical protein NTW16_00705 [Bacteroidetes bacterium]|nr:hypothetical protein [Bacteroidota bacterium]